MASQRELLSESEHDRIYTREIRPSYLESVDRSLAHTAVLVGGQPDAGKSRAMRNVNARLAATSGTAVVIAGDDLREFHPHWQAHGRNDPNAARDTQRDAGLWYQRLYREAIDICRFVRTAGSALRAALAAVASSCRALAANHLNASRVTIKNLGEQIK